MSYNAANRKDVRRLEKQAKLDERARLDTTRSLMASAAGRQWVYESLRDCHVFASSFSLNAQEVAFKEGERNVGLRLLNDIMNASPDEYITMMREANVRDSLSEQRGSTDGHGGDPGFESASDEPASTAESDAD